MANNPINKVMGAGAGLTPLIPFDMIIDTDVGILEVLKEKYLDPDVFNADYFLTHNRMDMIYDLYHRKDENPLYIVCNEGYEEVCDRLLPQFYEREYDMILEEAEITEIFDFVQACVKDSDMHPTIMYDGEKQLKLIKSYKSIANCPTLDINKIGPRTFRNYQQYFFKSIPDATPFAKHLRNKTIYFGAYEYNLDDENGINPHPVVDILAENNRISLIDVYSPNRFKVKERPRKDAKLL